MELKVENNPTLTKLNQSVMSNDADSLMKARAKKQKEQQQLLRIEQLEKQITNLDSKLDSILNLLQSKGN